MGLTQFLLFLTCVFSSGALVPPLAEPPTTTTDGVMSKEEIADIYDTYFKRDPTPVVQARAVLPVYTPTDLNREKNEYMIDIFMEESCSSPSYVYNATGSTWYLYKPNGSHADISIQRVWKFSGESGERVTTSYLMEKEFRMEGTLYIEKLNSKDRSMNFRFDYVNESPSCFWNEKDSDQECGSCTTWKFSDNGKFGDFRCDERKEKSRWHVAACRFYTKT
ncbi:hypothetical protein K458DRAFT_484410 [Lentithecium fluviatile CBS 122367]|uniref:Uncharacterized protein n=1 Tax=Lentithecium fluviatile CBS 122367 TaxID=1168545 RepID=A0A6G1JDJ2_9PLEO|nr:hypothetical protein K458DRAFT_484410 [Lentithecium fluviatile CBS 122367]